MEAYKIAGGVLAGVGVVAALPVMGAIGTVSLIGAVVGGTLGGVAGAVASELEEEERNNRSTIEGDEEVAQEDEPNEWTLALERVRAELQEDEAFFSLIIALGTIGAVATRTYRGHRQFGSLNWVKKMSECFEELDLPEAIQEQLKSFDIQQYVMFSSVLLSDQEPNEPPTLLDVIEQVRGLDEKVKHQLSVLLEQLIPETTDLISKSSIGADEVVAVVKLLVGNNAGDVEIESVI